MGVALLVKQDSDLAWDLGATFAVLAVKLRVKYRVVRFRSEPVGAGHIELYCPVFASPASRFVHLAGFGP